MQASTTVSDEAGRKLGGNRLIAHLVAAQRVFGERRKFRGTNQRHLAALREIVDQLSRVLAFDGAPGAKHGDAFCP